MGSAKCITYCHFKGRWCPLVPKRIFQVFPPERGLDGPGGEGSWTPRAAWHSLLDPLQIRWLFTSSCCVLLLFPPVPRPCQLPVLPWARLRQVSSRSLWDKGAFVCSAAGGTQPARRCFVPTCLPSHPPAGPRGAGKRGRALPGFRVQPGVWDKNPPPKKCRQKIHSPPAWGCVSARPRAGTGTGFEQVLPCGVPWGVWGALMGWEQVGSILPKLEPRSSSCCAPPTAHLFYLRILHNQGQLDFLTAPRILSSCLRHNRAPVFSFSFFFPPILNFFLDFFWFNFSQLQSTVIYSQISFFKNIKFNFNPSSSCVTVL